jgi:hypothetical protein
VAQATRQWVEGQKSKVEGQNNEPRPKMAGLDEIPPHHVKTGPAQK